jgi:hypothetical protein
MRDDSHGFEIVLAYPPHRAKKVGKDVRARSLPSCIPYLDGALHFKCDDYVPALFRSDFDKIRTPIVNHIVHIDIAKPWLP